MHMICRTGAKWQVAVKATLPEVPVHRGGDKGKLDVVFHAPLLLKVITQS